MTTHLQTAAKRRLDYPGKPRVKPSTPANPDAPPALPALREHIADLRVRADAAREHAATGLPLPAANTPMVPVFATPIPAAEILTADRDTEKREEKIRKLLSERGPNRLLGAVAGPELAASLADLYRTHPNFGEAIDLVVGEERLARQRGTAICGLRLLLTGAPGIGKTDFAQALSVTLGVPMMVISMSSAQSSAAIGGSESHYSNSQPGQVFSLLVQGTHANAIIVLDEIEKASTAWGDPSAALYQLLEPRTAKQFIDKAVPSLPLDASRVNWIATANSIAPLHEAIVSRFVVIDAHAPQEDQLRGLIQSLYSTLIAEFNLTGHFPARLNRQSESALLGGSIRDVKRRLRSGLGEALRIGAKELVIAPTEISAMQRRIGFI